MKSMVGMVQGPQQPSMGGNSDLIKMAMMSMMGGQGGGQAQGVNPLMQTPGSSYQATPYSRNVDIGEVIKKAMGMRTSPMMGMGGF